MLRFFFFRYWKFALTLAFSTQQTAPETNVVAVCGLGPKDAGKYNGEMEEKLRNKLSQMQAGAVGLVGLDATVTDPPFNTQMKALEGQVRIAVQNELALVLTLIPDPDKKELDVYRAATLVLDRVSFSPLFYSNHQPSNRKPQELI